jgi:hypothetical protein
LTAPQGGKAFGITLPVAKNHNATSITGPALQELGVDVGSTPATLPLTYAAASSDQSQASLTVRENYGINRLQFLLRAGLIPTVP